MEGMRRKHIRKRLLRTGLLFGAADDKCLECLVWNISAGGAMIEVQNEIEFEANGRFICEPLSLNRAYSLIWREGSKIGVAFTE